MEKRNKVVVLALGCLVCVVGLQTFFQYRTSGVVERQAVLTATAVDLLRVPLAGTAGVADSQTAQALGRLNELLTELQAGRANSMVSGDMMIDAAILLTRATDTNIRNYAAQILGAIGGAGAEARLMEMATEDKQSRQYALQGLRSMGSRRAGELIMEMLRSGVQNDMQTAANNVNGMLTAEMLPEVLEIMGGLPYGQQSRLTQVRRSLYNALRELSDPSACPALLVAVENEMDDYSRQNAIQALLGCVGRQQLELVAGVLDVLGPCGNNANYNSHYQIVQYLGQTGDLRATAPVLKALASDNVNLKRSCLEALARLQDPLAAPQLVDMLNSDDQNLAQHAVQYLRNGYPGIDVIDGKYSLVSADRMQELLARRAAAVAKLNERFGGSPDQQ